eukprot:GHVR01180063.1.p1 GENE.GHVR01180063.1~~GHVR01180063.1.p1  ORF type:complete len:484 (+),score=88.19 GHVR01180063.1:313-1764(+)
MRKNSRGAPIGEISVDSSTTTTTEDIIGTPITSDIPPRCSCTVKSYIGIVFAFIAAFCISVSTLTTKIASEDFSIFQLCQVRGLTLLVICSSYMLCCGIYNTRGVCGFRHIIRIISNIKPLGPRETIFWVCLSGLIEAMGIIFFYLAIFILPIGDAISLIRITPFIAAVLAVLWLKEEWGAYLVLAGLLSITGVVFVSRPQAIFGQPDSQQELHDTVPLWVGVFFGIGAAMSMGCDDVVVGRIGGGTSRVAIKFAFSLFLFIFTSVGVLVSAPYDLNVLSQVTLKGWLCLGLQAVFGFLSQLFITLTLKMEAAGSTGKEQKSFFIMNFAVIITFNFQVLIMGEAVSKTSLLGSILVLSGGILVLLYKLIPNFFKNYFSLKCVFSMIHVSEKEKPLPQPYDEGHPSPHNVPELSVTNKHESQPLPVTHTHTHPHTSADIESGHKHTNAHTQASCTQTRKQTSDTLTTDIQTQDVTHTPEGNTHT